MELANYGSQQDINASAETVPEERIPMLKKLHKALLVCFNLTVIEPFLLLMMFSFSLLSMTNVTFLMQMVCSSQKNYSAEVCQNFLHDDQYQQQKIIIQKSANNWGIINSVVPVLPTVFLSLFAGPWSDKYGRRLALVMPITGTLISSIMLIAISYADHKYSPISIILANIPTGLTGTYITMFIGLSYIADITLEQDRSMKLIFVEGIMMLGIPLGYLVAGYIYKLHGFGPVYILVLASQICAMVLGMLFLKETRGLDNEDSWKTRLKYFFSLNALKASFGACWRTRAGKNRCLLGLLVLSISAFMFFMRGFVSIFQAMIPPLIRSAITKIVDANEIGKIFALVSSLELATPIFAAVIYSQVYNNTVEFFPSCCYFMAGFVFMWPMITFMSMDLFSKSPQKNDERQPILGSVNQKP
ncbi:Proton-coupled folate transporter [Nymphon striatum]|nr:Proton-coupled folate transporter [Nymphon striatum]